MKKTFKTVSLLIITSLVIVTMNNCNKTNPSTVNMESPNDQAELFEESKAIQEHILAFKSKMEYHHDNPHLKDDGIFYTAPDAVYELEALLNYNFCYTDIEVNKKKFVKTEVTMPLDALHTIGESKLAQLYYEEIIDSIQAQMLLINYANMKLLLVDLEQTGTDSNGDAIVSIGALVGNEESVNSTDEVGYWFGGLLGTCQHEGSGAIDATVVLCSDIMFVRFPAPPPGKTWRKRNIITLLPILPQDHFIVPEDQRDNFKDSKLFYANKNYGTITDDTRCLLGYNEDDSEMSFYIDHYQQFITEAEIEYELDFTDCCIEDYEEYQNNTHSKIWHELQISLGNVWFAYEINIEDILEY